MKTSNHNNNLGELLKSYYQGSLSEEKSKELESLASQDEFLADAMEGHNEFPTAIASIPSFKPKSSSSLWIGISALVLASTLGLFFFLSPKTPITPKQTAQIIPTVSKETDTMLSLPVPEIKTEIIVPVTTIKEKKTKISPQVSEEKEIPRREYFEIPKMELTPMETQEKEEYVRHKTKTKALLYYDFLAIDYSVIYTNTIPLEENFEGIDASKANKNEKGIETNKGEIKKTISYKEQLKNSLFYLKDKNYTLAIENFELILTHYPQDANAQFYIGYALYYQEKYDKAISYFDKAMENSFDFFLEDAEWFKANSLENNGNFKKAQAIYKQIKNKGGYYSYQVR